MKYDYGLIMETPDGHAYKLYFTDDQQWGYDWDFNVIAEDSAGREICITYYPPHLDRYDDEQDWEYADRCVEEIDWEHPDYIEDISADPDSPYYYDREKDSGVTFRYVLTFKKEGEHHEKARYSRHEDDRPQGRRW